MVIVLKHCTLLPSDGYRGPLGIYSVVVVVTFFNKTLTIAKQHWHISIKEHITGLGAITRKEIINPDIIITQIRHW